MAPETIRPRPAAPDLAAPDRAAGAIRLGMVRLTDAAPIVLAQVRGLFAAEGLNVTVAVEPSWANVAD